MSPILLAPRGPASSGGGSCRRICHERRRGERGFSLLELATVLVLIGVLIAASVFSFQRARAAEQFDGWTRFLVAELSTARQTAVTSRTAVTLTIAEKSYEIETTGTVIRRAPLPQDISISTTCAKSACGFDRWGVPAPAGTVTLSSASTGHQHVITIEPGTGSVWYR
jgi:prepilin-type N-terminal cleavage/methylation domain-containing protein